MAWLHLKDAAPWGWIFLGSFVCLLVLAGIADLTLGTSGNGEDYSCPRGMSLNDNC
ncbi:hypothetical protein [Aminobacter sp. MSH1]|uniref:hypothetical protein n=1 Tax=Aminobacter sp. MSH1 TaxID=374606 RepID=UPI00131ED33B|nr:hypothetical protein [Aminobacter sp. MSH1]